MRCRVFNTIASASDDRGAVELFANELLTLVYAVRDRADFQKLAADVAASDGLRSHGLRSL